MPFEFPPRPEDWTLAKLEEALAARLPEWTTFEVKEKFSERVPETLCAFSNTHGGWLIVGVTNEWKLVGVEKADARFLDDHRRQILPALGGDAPHFIALENGHFVCVAWIPEGGLKPYRTAGGGHYVRAGSTNRLMTPGELADAFLPTEDLRQKGRLLLAELVHARDTYLRAMHQHQDGRAVLSFAKLDAGLLGQLTVAVAPLLREHGQVLRSLQEARWVAEEYNSGMDRVLHVLPQSSSVGFRARIMPVNDHSPEVQRLSGFLSELGSSVNTMAAEGLIRQLAAALGEPEPRFRTQEELFVR